jgi:hypothetical protein
MGNGASAQPAAPVDPKKIAALKVKFPGATQAELLKAIAVAEKKKAKALKAAGGTPDGSGPGAPSSSTGIRARFNERQSAKKLKSSLEAVVAMLQKLIKDKRFSVREARRRVGDMLRSKGELDAREEVERLIREDYAIDGLESLQWCAERLLARFAGDKASGGKASGGKAPGDASEARPLSAALVYAQELPNVALSEPERKRVGMTLKGLSAPLSSAFGDGVVASTSESACAWVDEGVRPWLLASQADPHPSLIDTYLETIATGFGVGRRTQRLIWSPTERSPLDYLAESFAFDDGAAMVRPAASQRREAQAEDGRTSTAWRPASSSVDVLDERLLDERERCVPFSVSWRDGPQGAVVAIGNDEGVVVLREVETRAPRDVGHSAKGNGADLAFHVSLDGTAGRLYTGPAQTEASDPELNERVLAQRRAARLESEALAAEAAAEEAARRATNKRMRAAVARAELLVADTAPE